MKLAIDPTDPSVSILVVEDAAPNREIICSLLKDNFPLAKVYAPANLFQQGAENLIKMGGYTVFMLDTSLAGWGEHPRFGEWGEKMIPFILGHCSNAIIIAIGTKADENERMLRKGAHYAIEKRFFLDTQFAKDLLFPFVAVSA